MMEFEQFLIKIETVYILEVSFFPQYFLSPFAGQNVVGMKDKDISKIIEENDQVVTVTVIPNFLYRHMMKK